MHLISKKKLAAILIAEFLLSVVVRSIREAKMSDRDP